jgi:inner membrane protein
MHIQTHVMSGWCLANCFQLNARERFLCMLAASLPDCDGLGLLFGQEAYWDYHHVLAHNLLVAVLLSLALTGFSRHKLKCFAIYLGLFHLHLLMDYFGSGEGWGVLYFWPFGRDSYESEHCWGLYSWQNLSFGAFFLLWTLLIAAVKKRTPLEWLMPGLDAKLAAAVGRFR